MAIPDTIIFATPTLRIGTFRCRPWEPWFEDSGPISGHLIVFPRTSVCITHAGSRPIVTDPNLVMLYNDRQEYRRGKISERGDLCEWFEFAPEIVQEAVRPFDPAVDDRRPFRLTHGPSDTRSYLLQRQIVEQIAGQKQPDQMYVEEMMLAVLNAVVRSAYQSAGKKTGASDRQRDSATIELIYGVKHVLATRFTERITLDQIAQAVYCSPYHLCRIFRQQTGSSIHAYLNHLRLRTALEYLSEGADDLAALGVALGYSSHSHFTQAFKRAFGTSPSALRPARHQLHELSKILIA